MTLYTLNLAKPISLVAENPAYWQALLGDDTAGAETLLTWDEARLLHQTEDGPKCSATLPPPHAASRSPQAAESGDPSAGLASGRYAFCQGRLNTMADLAPTIEWFARESWWQRLTLQGPVLVRLVREDGHTALQVLRRLAEDSEPMTD